MKKIIVISIILSIILIIAYLKFSPASAPTDPRGSNYAGSAACVKCHGDLFKSYIHTAHYIASSAASLNTIHGSFTRGSNTFVIDSFQKIIMEKHGDKLFQSYYKKNKLIESRQFDLVLGGIKGESYLYWNGNGLDQLPVSYYTKLNEWLLSPRFDPRFVNFNRAITSRCLECHASYIGDQAGKPQGLADAEQFEKTSLIYSVDCERCHGPGAKHVEFQTNNPNIKTSQFITRFSSLPRARRMDLCGICHSGNKSEMLTSTFGFKPGDNLANFKLPDFEHKSDTGHLDVHGNQVQLLESSKCFIKSNMDCATCHDTHQNQRGNTLLFTQKCLSCHSITNHNYCKMVNSQNAQLIKSNCIKCHMPALATRAIVSQDVNKASFADILVHTHRIAIYPDQVKKTLLMLTK